MSSACLQQIIAPPGSGVALWRVDLDSDAGSLSLDWLEPAEAERGRRLRDPVDARRFLVSRMALRQVLAAACDRLPGSFAYSRGEFGKPYIADAAVHFNLSRSGPEALIGLSHECPIGVDMEVVRQLSDREALVRLHFTEPEQEGWTASDEATRDLRFLECWTRKEACVKALGTGLRTPPGLVQAGFAAGLGKAVIQGGPAACELPVWSVYPAEGVVAAVAIWRGQV
jgi:4'-phosphopantetheinyl transferase